MRHAHTTLAPLILRAATQLVDAIQDGLANSGFDDVRPAHGFVFVRVSAGNATVADVAEHLGVSKQAASQLVEQLVLRGYLERRPHPGDARSTMLSLTERGKKCTRVAQAIASRFEDTWRRKLGPKAFPQLMNALEATVEPGPLRPSW